jgi:hypothetical protein
MKVVPRIDDQLMLHHCMQHFEPHSENTRVEVQSTLGGSSGWDSRRLDLSLCEETEVTRSIVERRKRRRTNDRRHNTCKEKRIETSQSDHSLHLIV